MHPKTILFSVPRSVCNSERCPVVVKIRTDLTRTANLLAIQMEPGQIKSKISIFYKKRNKYGIIHKNAKEMMRIGAETPV